MIALMAWLGGVLSQFGERQGVSHTLADFGRPPRIFACGVDGNEPDKNLAKLLFHSYPITLTPLAWDIVGTQDIVYVTSDCTSELSAFVGKVIYFNGESNAAVSIRSRDRHFYIGPIGATVSDSAMQFYGVAKYLAFHTPLVTERTIERTTRVRGTSFLIYAARNCVEHRERAFDRIVVNFGVGDAVGCYGKHPERRIPPGKFPGRGEFNSNHLAFQKYRFVLCMENRNATGYITEKILNAFLSGSVPVYYGTREVFDLFNRKAFIFYDINDPDKVRL